MAKRIRESVKSPIKFNKAGMTYGIDKDLYLDMYTDKDLKAKQSRCGALKQCAACGKQVRSFRKHRKVCTGTAWIEQKTERLQHKGAGTVLLDFDTNAKSAKFETISIDTPVLPTMEERRKEIEGLQEKRDSVRIYTQAQAMVRDEVYQASHNSDKHGRTESQTELLDYIGLDLQDGKLKRF
jgi:hypothetical protein